MNFKAVSISLVLLFSGSTFAEKRVDVMTHNQYIGADLMPLLTAAPAAFNGVLVATLQQAAANRFSARARELAALIGKRMPHLVSLQEVFELRCTNLVTPPPVNAGCQDPSIEGAFVDHRAETLAALADIGAPYYVAATVKNLDLSVVSIPGFPPGIPFSINGVPAVLTVIDRDMVLAREDVAAIPVNYAELGACAKPSLDGCNFQAVVSAALPGGGSIAVERGFVGVDAEVDGEGFRFIATHLEVFDPNLPIFNFYQSAQAMELLQVLEATTPPDKKLIVAGDLNSSPEQQVIPGPFPIQPPFDQFIAPPYLLFESAGYVDAWEFRPGRADGFTCCQLVDLSNHVSELNERIDLILSREIPTRVKKARVLGHRVSDKTMPEGRGIWPSDHGAVAVELFFE
jgi:hypothetical protein